MSSISENSKITARQFYEGYNNHDLQRTFDDYISENLINHALGGIFNRAQWLDYDKASLAAVPDLVATVIDQVAEGNKVYTRWMHEGTHTEPFFDKPASGNHIRFEAVSIDIIENGKIVEHNSFGDFSAVMQQFVIKQNG